MARDADDAGEKDREQAGDRSHGESMGEDAEESLRVDADAGLPGVSGDLGRGLSGIAEGVGGPFSGLARAGLDAVEGTAEERERAAPSEAEAAGARDHDCDDPPQASSAGRGES
jgi:hypothetical protein